MRKTTTKTMPKTLPPVRAGALMGPAGFQVCDRCSLLVETPPGHLKPLDCIAGARGVVMELQTKIEVLEQDLRHSKNSLARHEVAMFREVRKKLHLARR
jgi:hypothetical protein